MYNAQHLVELLRIHDSTRGLNSDEISAIAKVAVLREYLPGEKALVTGKPATAISLIISGLFTMSLTDDVRNGFGYLGPNDQIGTLLIVQDSDSLSNVVANEPSLVVEIESVAAQALMSQNKIFARNLLGTASANMTQNAINGGSRHCPHRIAFVHLRSETKSVAASIQSRLLEIGECLGRIVNESVGAVNYELASCPTLSLLESESTQIEHDIRSQLAEWKHLDRVVFDIDFEHISLNISHLRGLLSFPERVYILVEPETAHYIVPVIKDVLAEHPGWSDKLNVLWVLNEQHDVSPYLPELTSLCKRVFKIKLSTESEPFFQRTSQPGIERVVHDLRGFRIGLALGGGAARGMCHLGVLKAFDECGIIVDRMAGTSVGAMMGVSYCCGYSPDNGVKRFTDALTPSGFSKLIGDKLYMLYKYRTHSWEKMLREHFFNWQLEQMLVPLTTIATDLVSAKEFVRESGDAVTGILESINLGGISIPICRDGMALVDGGYLNNVPADTLVRQGADFVISVDVTKTITKRFAGNTSETPTEQMSLPRIGQVLGRIREVAQKNLSLMGAAHADFTIAPDVSHVPFADFKSTPATAQIGYQAAMRVMTELKQELHQADPQLFPLDTATGSNPDRMIETNQVLRKAS